MINNRREYFWCGTKHRFRVIKNLFCWYLDYVLENIYSQYSFDIFFLSFWGDFTDKNSLVKKKGTTHVYNTICVFTCLFLDIILWISSTCVFLFARPYKNMIILFPQYVCHHEFSYHLYKRKYQNFSSRFQDAPASNVCIFFENIYHNVYTRFCCTLFVVASSWWLMKWICPNPPGSHHWHWDNSTSPGEVPHGPLTSYVKLGVAHALGIPGTYCPPPRVNDPDMHHGTCVTHVSWCMSGLLTSCFLWSRWRGKRSRHSRRMRNPQFYVSGKRPMVIYT